MTCSRSEALRLDHRVLLRTGRAITGVNQTIEYVPPSGSLDRFGHATNWFFVGMMVLSGAVYFANGIRYDTTSAGASPENVVHRCLRPSREAERLRHCGGAVTASTLSDQHGYDCGGAHLSAVDHGAHKPALGAVLGTLTLGMVITIQTTYILGQLPGTPVFYRQFSDHLAWSTGNAG